MTSIAIGSLVFVSVFGAALLAIVFRLRLPEDHLSSEAKDTVKLAMGLVATMTALVLGLLVASAKGSYDADRNQVTAMSAKIAFLDRVLAIYGPESAEARESVRFAVQRMVERLWPESTQQPAQLDPRLASASAETAYREVQRLVPKNDIQRSLQTQALGIIYDLAQMRWMLFEQAESSISMPLLVVVICWLTIIFFSFGLFAPANGTVITALMVAALSVAGAIFLILELDQPFGGLIKISNKPMLKTLNHLGN